MSGTVIALRVAIARSYALIIGPPRNDVSSSSPAGSFNVLSFIPSRRAVALRSAANASRLPLPTVSAIAYAASLAETILIAASIWSSGHCLPTSSPMRMVSTVASRASAVTVAPGHRRSTAVSAVMIFEVLAGCTALWTWSPISTLPVPASTTMSAAGENKGSAPAGAAGPGVRPTTVATAMATDATPATTARRRGRCMGFQGRRKGPARGGSWCGQGVENGSGTQRWTCHHGAVPTSSSRISARIAAIQESATLAVDAKAKALKAAGENVIGFGAGEPDFPTPAHVVDAAIKACSDPRFHHYSPTPGLPELREAIALKTKRDSGVDCAAAQVVVTNGGKHAVYNTFQVLCDEGDEVLLPAPYWTSYPEIITLGGGIPVVLPTNETTGFRVSIEQLDAALTPRTKALLFV